MDRVHRVVDHTHGSVHGPLHGPSGAAHRCVAEGARPVQRQGATLGKKTRGVVGVT
jgi:hypothetical protein